MDKKELRWNFVFQYGYVITNIINAIILLPIYLLKIDASTLGVWLATGNILAWMTLIDPGVGEVLQQKIAELLGKNLKEEISKTIGSGLIAAAIILLLAVVAGFIFYSLIGAIIDKDVTKYPNLQIALFLTIIATGMSLTSFSMSGINLGLHNAAQVAISSIIANILFLIVNITLLVFGFGIISIAFANVCRALFINIYNFSTLKVVLNRERMRIIFEKSHFKRFIKIFSFTSLSSIIGGLSASMDTIFLARFIAPSMITILEINKRPVQQAQQLVGRHSVALMPTISHALGRDDKKGILNLINIQFRYYSYAVIFMAFCFFFNYQDLITAWTGKGKYAGNLIVYLLIANFFFYLIGYFMSNIGYALGDIKMNSLINISKGIFIGILYYAAAKYFGIPGVLTVMLAGYLIIDFCTFSYRLYKIGYLEKNLIASTLRSWAITIPLLAAAGFGCAFLTNHLVTTDIHLLKVVINGTLFTFMFLLIVLRTDGILKAEVTRLLAPVGSLFKKGKVIKNNVL